MAPIVYEATVHSAEVSFKNFHGVVKTQILRFALDPLSLMELMVDISIEDSNANRADRRSGASKRGMTDKQQMEMLRDLAIKSAGSPSENGDEWLPNDQFETSLPGKAFLTQLISSDAVRADFSQRVIIDPFEAFVSYAREDLSNSKEEVANLEKSLVTLKRMFAEPSSTETLEDRKARLQRELAGLDVADAPAN